MFFQPELERAIDAACAQRGVTVERGWVARAGRTDDGVQLTLQRVTEDEPGRLRRPATRARSARAG